MKNGSTKTAESNHSPEQSGRELSDRVWITKYALTKGVLSLDGGKPDKNGYFHRNGTFTGSWNERRHFYARSDWHVSYEQALARAEEMRTTKIASLRQQIAKLDKLSFNSVRGAS